jgi:tetratricopeptide (TPR) repeat protein
MPTKPIPDLALVLTFLRAGQGWSQTELGEAANVPRNLLNDYEAGRKPLNRRRLEHLISFMNLPPEVIEETLDRLHKNRAASRAPRPAPGSPAHVHQRTEAVAAKVGRLATDFTRDALSLVTLEAKPLRARQEAERLWARLRRRKPDERLALVEEARAFRTWALVERVAAESIAAAPSSPAQALELAELALRMAQLCPGEEWLRCRAQGYAWFHVGNARRVLNDLPGAEAALVKAMRLWEEGAGGEPGLFNEGIVLALEADLLYEQRHFQPALRRIEKALAVDAGGARGWLLLLKAQILEALGDTEGSTKVLHEAVLYVDEEKEPRTALGVRFHLLVNLCLEGRAGEAAAGLPAVRALAERLGQEMDLLQVVWLSGKIAAGCGDTEEAEAAFEQARRGFANHEPPLVVNDALVSLDLALLLLEQGRTAEVRTLAAQMARIFKSQGVHPEALAALRVFCESARREAATVELARRIVRFLHRSQFDPKLQFEDGGEAEA